LEFHPSGIFRDGAHTHILLSSLGISTKQAPDPFAKAMDRIEDIRYQHRTPALGCRSVTFDVDFFDYPQDSA